ncbi:hypothetical protein [Sinomonas flava]|uniref:hypothetical protein n=1 Tax=Sinomonas flava TaxID=496857 RepID=UPI0039A61535
MSAELSNDSFIGRLLEIAEVVARQLEVFRGFGHLETVERMVERLAESVVSAVRWHA